MLPELPDRLKLDEKNFAASPSPEDGVHVTALPSHRLGCKFTDALDYIVMTAYLGVVLGLGICFIRGKEDTLPIQRTPHAMVGDQDLLPDVVAEHYVACLSGRSGIPP